MKKTFQKMEVSLTEFIVDESQYSYVKEVRTAQPLYSVLKENKFTKKLALFSPIPFVPHQLMKISKLAHFALLPIIGCVLESDQKRFQIVERATKTTLKDILDALKKKEPISNRTAFNPQNIAFGICSAMKYAEEKGLRHGNLTIESIYLNKDYHPHIQGVGLNNIWQSQQASSDIKAFGNILQTLFSCDQETYAAELKVAADIKSGIVKSFAQCYEQLKPETTYAKTVFEADEARNNAEKEVEYAETLVQIGTALAARQANIIFAKHGKAPCREPPVNAIEIPDVPLFQFSNEIPLKKIEELNVPYATAFIKESDDHLKKMTVQVPYNNTTRKLLKLIHPVLASPVSVIMNDAKNPFQIVFEYGEKLDKEHTPEALLAIAAALTYCHENGFHHGCLNEQFITLHNKFAKLSYVGIAEILGHKITDKDDIQQFGKLALKLWKDAPENIAEIFNMCVKGQITMKCAYKKLAASGISDDYYITLAQFESFRCQLYQGDVDAAISIKEHFVVMSQSTIECSLMDIIMQKIQADFTRTQNGSILHHAVLINDIELVKSLVKSGFNPREQSQEGRTALHYAAMGNNYNMYKLLEKQVDTNIRDAYGKTAIDYATKDMEWRILSKRNTFLSSAIRCIANHFLLK